MGDRYYIKDSDTGSGVIYYVMDRATGEPTHWGGYLVRRDAERHMAALRNARDFR